MVRERVAEIFVDKEVDKEGTRYHIGIEWREGRTLLLEYHRVILAIIRNLLDDYYAEMLEEGLMKKGSWKRE